jgi:hypothetical protein
VIFYLTGFEVARYVIYDDVIIAVKTSTNVNDINNSYNIYIKKTSQRPADGKMEVVM